MADKRKPLDLDKISGIVAREMAGAIGQDGDRLSEARRTALAYYEGEPLGNEIEGRSQVVMRPVLEVVEWTLPALLRIFTASDKIAEIEPNHERDEESAEQATQYVSHIFYKDNDGFELLHDWIKDGLLGRLGWVKYWWDTQKIVETNSFTGVTSEEYEATKLLNPEAEFLDVRHYPAPPAEGFNLDAPAPGAAMLCDYKMRVTRTEGRVRIENVPPEEVLFARGSKRDRQPFLCHRPRTTISDLVQEGYDEDQFDDIGGADASIAGSEETDRRDAEEDGMPNERADPSMRELRKEESYVKLDYDGDGIAELCKVVTVNNGKVVLTKGGKPDVEPIDEMPLVPFCPVPMPHKLAGLSLADLVMDLQVWKTALVRAINDNINLTNIPRHAIAEGATTDETYDDLLTARPGGIVRMKDINGIMPLTTPFVAEKTFPLLEYVDQTLETRTGVSRHNQGLNPDDLNKTATGVNLMQQAAAQRVELIARIGATAVKRLVSGILGLVQKHQQQERIIRVTGKWLKMDPREWKNQMAVSVSVGLGTGNRDQILQHLMTILQIQQGIVATQHGVQGPLVYAKNVYDTVEAITENAGFKQSFVADPDQPPPEGAQPQGQQPDPRMIEAHGKLQIAQMQAQTQAQLDQAKHEFEMMTERTRMQFEMMLEQQKSEHKMQLEAAKLQAQHERAMQETELKFQAGAYTPGPAPAEKGAAA